MKSIRYYIASCLSCSKPVMFKVDFLEFDGECCVDFKHLKVLRIFNDEKEARNYLLTLNNEI